jgi:hypothetical protein
MMTNSTAAYGMYSRNVALPDVVGALNEAGFTHQDICMVLSPAHPDAAAVRDASMFPAIEADNTVTARMISWFSRFGAVVIPTVGLFVRSQAFLQALMTDHNIPSLSGGSRILLDLGFSRDDAKRLGTRLSDVGALVYVNCKEIEKANGAIELLRRTGAMEAASLSAINAVKAAAVAA